MIAPLTAACIASAASLFGVAEPMLWTILKAEGGRVGQCVLQASGSNDCGPAQVNANVWAPHFARLTGRPETEIWRDLRDDGCFNVHAAAYIYRIKVREAGGDRWDAAGRYNSATPGIKQAYQARLIATYASMFLGGRRPAPR